MILYFSVEMVSSDHESLQVKSVQEIQALVEQEKQEITSLVSLWNRTFSNDAKDIQDNRSIEHLMTQWYGYLGKEYKTIKERKIVWDIAFWARALHKDEMISSEELIALLDHEEEFYILLKKELQDAFSPYRQYGKFEQLWNFLEQRYKKKVEKKVVLPTQKDIAGAIGDTKLPASSVSPSNQFPSKPGGDGKEYEPKYRWEKY